MFKANHSGRFPVKFHKIAEQWNAILLNSNRQKCGFKIVTRWIGVRFFTHINKRNQLLFVFLYTNICCMLVVVRRYKCDANGLSACLCVCVLRFEQVTAAACTNTKLHGLIDNGRIRRVCAFFYISFLNTRYGYCSGFQTDVSTTALVKEGAK